eukprot:5730629-Pyramimonas_sp.AAC.1
MSDMCVCECVRARWRVLRCCSELNFQQGFADAAPERGHARRDMRDMASLKLRLRRRGRRPRRVRARSARYLSTAPMQARTLLRCARTSACRKLAV